MSRRSRVNTVAAISSGHPRSTPPFGQVTLNPRVILLVVFHVKYAAEPKAGITDAMIAIPIALIIRNEADLLQTSSLSLWSKDVRKGRGKHSICFGYDPLIYDSKVWEKVSALVNVNMENVLPQCQP